MAKTPTIRLRLHEVMEDRGISSLAEVVRLTGVSYPTVLSLEKGRAQGIFWPVMAKLCEGLECTPSDLFEVIPSKRRKRVEPEPVPLAPVFPEEPWSCPSCGTRNAGKLMKAVACGACSAPRPLPVPASP